MSKSGAGRAGSSVTDTAGMSEKCAKPACVRTVQGLADIVRDAEDALVACTKSVGQIEAENTLYSVQDSVNWCRASAWATRRTPHGTMTLAPIENTGSEKEDGTLKEGRTTTSFSCGMWMS